MKNSGKCVVIISIIFLLAACGSSAPANDPESVAKAFLERLGRMDFNGAKELATKDGQKMLSMIQGFIAMADEEKKKEMEEEGQAGPPVIVSVDEQGDKAMVVYSMGDKKNQPLELLKENGQWKVNFQKEM